MPRVWLRLKSSVVIGPRKNPRGRIAAIKVLAKAFGHGFVQGETPLLGELV